MFRVYFFSLRSRTELRDHPLNGKTWISTSAMVRDAQGKFVKDTCDGVTVANFANLYEVKGERRVTIADFDEPEIAVKVWYGPGEVEWRKLVATDAFGGAL